MSTSQTAEFGPQLREWRQFRRLSQLELSLRAEISQRHLSWLETGRSRPSRRMVVQLCETLDMPLRDRNRLLHAAGFAALYRTTDLDGERMRAIRDGLRRMLDQQMPYPSLVMDREWNLLMTNACADALLGAVVDGEQWTQGDGPVNLARLTLHPDGLKPLIVNWQEAAAHFAQRLRRDLESSRDPDLCATLEGLIELAAEGLDERAEPDLGLMPMLTLDLRFGDRLLRLFTVISTLGTAQDVTAEELRIESFFPADEASEQILKGLAGAL